MDPSAAGIGRLVPRLAGLDQYRLAVEATCVENDMPSGRYRLHLERPLDNLASGNEIDQIELRRAPSGHRHDATVVRGRSCAAPREFPGSGQKPMDSVGGINLRLVPSPEWHIFVCPNRDVFTRH